MTLPKTFSGYAAKPSIVVEAYVEMIEELEASLQKRSCRRYSGVIAKHGVCSETQLTYVNTFSMDRIVCGHIIKPKESVTLPVCREPSRLFAKIPDTSGNMAPISLRYDGKKGDIGKRFPCDIPCNDYGRWTIVTSRFVDVIDNTVWRFTLSMEGPQYYPELRRDPNAYKENHFYATTSYDSEVPLPYYFKGEIPNLRHKPVRFDTAIKGAMFMAKNCHSRNNREKLVKQLQASTFRIDSLSSCLHNAGLPPGVHSRDNKTAIMEKYLFYLAFENQNEPDYITEKFWKSLEAGTLPVYFGAQNIKEHAPQNSIIDVNDFESIEDLVAYLHVLAHNQTLYEEYHSWRKRPFDENFQIKHKMSDTISTCRMCRWAYARSYGLGWHHLNQSVQELQLSRDPCVSSQGLLYAPVLETWEDMTVSSLDTAEVSCPLSEASSSLLKSKSGGGLLNALRGKSQNKLRRTVYRHDGVIDIHVDDVNRVFGGANVFMQLKPAQADPSFVPVDTGHVRIQDEKSRTTVLTWPPNEIAVVANSTVRIHVDRVPFRVRIIVEDVDKFHKGADQEENFFGGLMKRDFLTPIEAFVEE